jgi:hypothetical protein
MEPGLEREERVERRARRFRARVLAVLIGKALAEVRLWRERRRQASRRAVAASELRYLSDRMLRDIGVRRSDLSRIG